MMYGIGKVSEESGELSEALNAYMLLKINGRLQQLLGKAIAFPVGDHPDGLGDLKTRLMNEIADLRAALLYFSKVNYDDDEQMVITERVSKKLDQFMRWGLTGIPAQPVEIKKGG